MSLLLILLSCTHMREHDASVRPAGDGRRRYCLGEVPLQIILLLPLLLATIVHELPLRTWPFFDHYSPLQHLVDTFGNDMQRGGTEDDRQGECQVARERWPRQSCNVLARTWTEKKRDGISRAGSSPAVNVNKGKGSQTLQGETKLQCWTGLAFIKGSGRRMGQ